MSVEKLSGFGEFEFKYQQREYPVYYRGQGPGVVIIHEIPGITPSVAKFAKLVADAGFTVYLPSLLGIPGKPFTVGYVLKSAAQACISREFAVLAANQSSPITDYLRALCRHAHSECGGPGVGALGMCLTGNFALSLMVEPCVMAPVLSQPSLPFGITKNHRSGLHISPQDLECVKQRLTKEDKKVLALRFSHDAGCTGARFKKLHQELGDNVETIVIDSAPGNEFRIPRYAHSVLTNDLVDEAGHPTVAARDRVLSFFAEHLNPDTESTNSQTNMK